MPLLKKFSERFLMATAATRYHIQSRFLNVVIAVLFLAPVLFAAALFFLTAALFLRLVGIR